MTRCVSGDNRTYCDMDTINQLFYQLDSYTPLGIKLWVLMLLGVLGILIWIFILDKLGFFDEKDSKISKSALQETK